MIGEDDDSKTGLAGRSGSRPVAAVKTSGRGSFSDSRKNYGEPLVFALSAIIVRMKYSSAESDWGAIVDMDVRSM